MHSFRKRRRGAALVEFAFVGILFFALLFGMIQFGIYLSVTNALWNLSREGARYAAVKPANPGVDDPTVYADITNHIKAVAPGILDKNKMTITFDPANSKDRQKQQPIKVTITYDMAGKRLLIMPGTKSGEEYKTLSNKFLGRYYTTSSSMMVER